VQRVQQDQQEMVKQARLAHKEIQDLQEMVKQEQQVLKDLQVPEAVQVLKVQQELY
jgi:hypothetical protein